MPGSHFHRLTQPSLIKKSLQCYYLQPKLWQEDQDRASLHVENSILATTSGSRPPCLSSFLSFLPSLYCQPTWPWQAIICTYTVKMPSKRASASNPPRGSAKATVERLFRSSAAGNKIRRQALFQQERLQRNREKRSRREKREKEREKLGDKVDICTHPTTPLSPLS